MLSRRTTVVVPSPLCLAQRNRGSRRVVPTRRGGCSRVRRVAKSDARGRASAARAWRRRQPLDRRCGVARALRTCREGGRSVGGRRRRAAGLPPTSPASQGRRRLARHRGQARSRSWRGCAQGGGGGAAGISQAPRLSPLRARGGRGGRPSGGSRQPQRVRARRTFTSPRGCACASPRAPPPVTTRRPPLAAGAPRRLPRPPPAATP